MVSAGAGSCSWRVTVVKSAVRSLRWTVWPSSAVAAQAARHLLDQLEQRLLDHGAIVHVLGEGGLAADRLALVSRAPPRADRAPTRGRGNAARAPRRRPRPAARRGRRATAPIVVAPRRWKPASDARSGAPQALHRQVGRNGADAVGRHHHQAVRLAEIGGDLRQELARRDADRRGDPFLAAHVVLDAPRDRRAVAEQRPAGGDVEERLVDAERLDQIGIARQDRHEALRHRRVQAAARPQVHRASGSADRPARSASPSGCRRRAPRSSPPRPRRGRARRADRRRPPPAGRRAPGSRAPRRRRRTRRGRRAGSCAARRSSAASPHPRTAPCRRCGL